MLDTKIRAIDNCTAQIPSGLIRGYVIYIALFYFALIYYWLVKLSRSNTVFDEMVGPSLFLMLAGLTAGFFWALLEESKRLMYASVIMFLGLVLAFEAARYLI